MMIKNQSLRKNTYLAIFILATILTTFLWILSKSQINIIFTSPLYSLGQLNGLLGFTLLSLTIFLTTKFIFLDKLFHGLDKTFRVHQVIGSIAFILLLSHPLSFLASDLPNTTLARSYLIPSANTSYTLGIAGLYLMFLSFIFVTFIKLPYHIWKLSHQLLGLAYLSGGIHSIIISSDISRFPPLQVWILFLLGLGITSAIYSIFFYSRVGPRYNFKVEKIERILDIINIYLSTVDKKFSFLPGQFIYTSFRSGKVGKERHPFTISSSPTDPLLRISTKILGDYTLRLPNLKEGVQAFLYGPYGQFGKHLFDKNDSTQLWVGGGIGITPFLSFAHSQKKIPPTQQVHFFYLFKNPEEGVFTKEIEDVIKDSPNLHFYSYCSKEKGLAKITIFTPLIKNPNATSVFLCGPISMMDSFKDQFISLGIPEEKIYMEKFSMD